MNFILLSEIIWVKPMLKLNEIFNQVLLKDKIEEIGNRSGSTDYNSLLVYYWHKLSDKFILVSSDTGIINPIDNDAEVGLDDEKVDVNDNTGCVYGCHFWFICIKCHI